MPNGHGVEFLADLTEEIREIRKSKKKTVGKPTENRTGEDEKKCEEEKSTEA